MILKFSLDKSPFEKSRRPREYINQRFPSERSLHCPKHLNLPSRYSRVVCSGLFVYRSSRPTILRGYRVRRVTVSGALLSLTDKNITESRPVSTNHSADGVGVTTSKMSAFVEEGPRYEGMRGQITQFVCGWVEIFTVLLPRRRKFFVYLFRATDQARIFVCYVVWVTSAKIRQFYVYRIIYER